MMNRPKQPQRWQLDVFMLLMVVLMLLLLQAHLSAFWEAAGEIGWCVLTLVGMGLWLHDNWSAIQREEQYSRRRRRVADPSETSDSRTIPLTPTQRRFLAVMQARTHREDAE